MCSYKTQLGITSYLFGEISLGWGFLMTFSFYKLCGKLGIVQNGTNPEKFTKAQSPINIKFAEEL